MLRADCGRHRFSERGPLTSRVEAALDPPAIDVERLEDLQHFVHGEAELHRPEDDVEVFAAVLEVFQDRIDQRRAAEGRWSRPKSS